MTTGRPRFFAHANVNTADVDRAEKFYVDFLELTPKWRTAPSRPQDGTGFGMPGVEVQWRGVLLADHRGDYGPVVDLLQWLLPRTEGTPDAEPNHIGLAALLFSVPDLKGLSSRLESAGRPVERHGETVITTDLDGTFLELVQSPQPPTYRGIRINCSDLAASSLFYVAALQLEGDEPSAITRG